MRVFVYLVLFISKLIVKEVDYAMVTGNGSHLLSCAMVWVQADRDVTDTSHEPVKANRFGTRDMQLIIVSRGWAFSGRRCC